MNILISGGCKNGKSMYAQKLAKKMAEELNVPLYYLATMITKDNEDQARVLRHRQEREGWGFETIEQGKNVCQCLNSVDSKGVFLFDSVTALLENEMFNEDYSFNKEAGAKVSKELVEFASKTGNTIFVSDYLYSDGNSYGDLTNEYMKALSTCDKALAKKCEKVI
ncbi:MAG: bifunctional adenosylcobinamide kinase/adenosylcobinamide-phosphate guanylyltransferase, partial [Anaerovoracaceae bacterium]